MSTLNKEQKIEEIEKTIKELSEQVEKLKEPEEEVFKFCEEGYITWSDGDQVRFLDNIFNKEKEVKRGRLFPTSDLSRKYDKIITNSYKIAQAVAQLAPEYEPDYKDFDDYKFYLSFDYSLKTWRAFSFSYTQILSVIPFPQSIKDRILDLANSGALDLDI